MIRITKHSDLDLLQDVPKVNEYVSQLLNYLLKEYGLYCPDRSISAIGAIFFVEELKEFDDYKAFGLAFPITIDCIEWATSFDDYSIICVTVDNDYAINIISKSELYNEWLKGAKNG